MMYDKKWMEDVLKEEEHSSKIISESILKHFKPNSIIDIGCGPGHFANELKRLGGDDIFVSALDNSKDVSQFINPKVHFIKHDLTKPLKFEKRFDVSLCLEVIEHLDEKYEDEICKTLVGSTRHFLIVSIAQPDQIIPEHVNLKPLEYWIKKFSSLGLIYRHDYRALLNNIWHDNDVKSYFTHNVLVFSRGVDIYA